MFGYTPYAPRHHSTLKHNKQIKDPDLISHSPLGGEPRTRLVPLLVYIARFIHPSTRRRSVSGTASSLRPARLSLSTSSPRWAVPRNRPCRPVVSPPLACTRATGSCCALTVLVMPVVLFQVTTGCTTSMLLLSLLLLLGLAQMLSDCLGLFCMEGLRGSWARAATGADGAGRAKGDVAATSCRSSLLVLLLVGLMLFRARVKTGLWSVYDICT